MIRMNLLHSRPKLMWSIKAVLVAVPLVGLVWLVNLRFVLFPRATFTLHRGAGPSAVAYTKSQLVRSAQTGAYAWLINSDTFHLSSRVPRRVQSLRVSLKVAASNAEYVSAVIAGNRQLGDRTAILYSATLNSLKWNKASAGGYTLWQRPSMTAEQADAMNAADQAGTKKIETRLVKQYASFADFTNDPPSMAKVGVAKLDSMAYVTVPDYHPSAQPITLPSALRGSQTIYVYAANEDLHVTFTKIDQNLVKGSDRLTIRVRRADAMSDDPSSPLYSLVVADDGSIGSSGVSKKHQPVEILIKNVRPGMYRIELSTNDDVLLEAFSSWQHVLGFGNKLFLAAGPAYRSNLAQASFSPVTVITNSRGLLLSTNHPEGKQTISIGKTKVNVNKTRSSFSVKLGDGLTKFSVSKADLILQNPGGLVTLAPFSLPGRGAVPVSLYPAPNLDALDYVIAPYTPTTSPIITYDRTFRFEDLQVSSKRNVSVRLDIPGLRANAYQIGLQSAKLTYIRGPFPWPQIWHKVKILLGGKT